jgi:hypothetical protein
MPISKKRPAPWSDNENRALVALYFAMLDKAISGKAYNKAAMIRTVQRGLTCNGDTLADAPLEARSKQSIEFKLMNASAAHAALDPDAITMHGHGFRAMPNYQATLKDAMRRVVELREINTGDISATGGHYAA